MFSAGNSTLAAATVLLGLLSVFHSLVNDQQVRQIAWRDGLWHLWLADGWKQVVPVGYAVAIPGLLHLVFGSVDGRTRYPIWVFTANKPHETLRRLRMRLRLEGFF